MSTKIPFIINFTDPALPGKQQFVVMPESSDGPLFPASDVPNTPGAAMHTTLILPGMGLPEYGQHIDEDLVYLLENFAGRSAPVKPTVGQKWYDYNAKAMKVWNGSVWFMIAGGGVVASVYEYNLLVEMINSIVSETYVVTGYVEPDFVL